MLELPRRAPGRGFNMATPLVDRHVDEGRGHLPALRVGDGALSYRALQALVNRAGNVLRAARVEPEQRVAILLPDGIEFVAAFIGAMKIGAVPVPLNTSAQADDLHFMLADSRAKAVVVQASLRAAVEQATSERPPCLFVVGDEPATAAADTTTGPATHTAGDQVAPAEAAAGRSLGDARAAPAIVDRSGGRMSGGRSPATASGAVSSEAPAANVGASAATAAPESGPATAEADGGHTGARVREIATPQVRDFTAAMAQASPALEAFPTGVDEPCYWLYSSGTTGRPKGVVHLHGDMLACVSPYAQEVVGIGPGDAVFSVPRLFFSYGLVNSLFLPLLAGACAILTPQRPDVAHTLDVVRRQRPTLFFTVPTSIAQLCAALEAASDRPFQSLRLAVSAGEPLPEPLYRRWLALTGVEALDGLGSTEVGYIFCSNRPGRVRPGSSGTLVGEHAARITDEQGHDLPDGEAGELWIRADSTALHYWNQRQRSKETFVGEWLRTGDLYVRDANGYLWYQGRLGDVFKVNGQWVSPLEVEGCLLEHPGVLECAVVGAPDDHGLLKPKVYVVRRPGATVEAAELQALARARLQPYKYPRWVEFVEALPKTATGKVQRFRLRDALPAIETAHSLRT